jgi:small-conductance mechanosensitive channel
MKGNWLLTGALVLTFILLAVVRSITSCYKASLTTAEDQKRLDPVIMAVRRFAAFIVLVFALSIALAHFGVNVNTLYIVLIICLAAKEVITDALSGFIILIDQPFRVGDSILIKDLNSWGDVLAEKPVDVFLWPLLIPRARYACAGGLLPSTMNILFSMK